MNKTKIYICGVDDAYKEKQDFEDTEKIKERLTKLRCTVIDPKDIPFAKTNWSDTLQSRVEQIKKSHAIYVLPNWRDSIMARIELTVAMDMKLHTFFHPISNKEIKQFITTLDG